MTCLNDKEARPVLRKALEDLLSCVEILVKMQNKGENIGVAHLPMVRKAKEALRSTRTRKPDTCDDCGGEPDSEYSNVCKACLKKRIDKINGHKVEELPKCRKQDGHCFNCKDLFSIGCRHVMVPLKGEKE